VAGHTCEIRIGTSGWYYDHWKGLFYPQELPKDRWFEHYARHFNTVEINNTFYHLPRASTLTRWQRLAPKGFLFAVKANRYITHVKKLKDVSEPLERFFEAVALLKGRLGAVLFQLPPSLSCDLELLAAFIKLLPKGTGAVFEFRHRSWYAEPTLELLTRCRACLCIHDMPGSESPCRATGDIVYARFHGTTGRYSGNYTARMLADWAGRLKQQARAARALYVYFNNDAHGHAVRNAGQLARLLAKQPAQTARR